MQANTDTETSPSIQDSRALLTTPPNTAPASPSDISSSRLVELDPDASQTAGLQDLSSSEPSKHDLCGPECLARRQLGALSALTPCHEDQAAVWTQSAGRNAVSDPSNAAQPLHGAAQPRPVDRSIVSPSTYTQLTNNIDPGTSWSPGNPIQGQASEAENISSIAFCGPMYGSACRQALLSTHDDNEYYTNLSSAPPLVGDDPQSIQASIQPSWSELSPIPTITSNVQGLPHHYLGGIGAWQAGSIPGSTNTPSPTSTRAHTDDLEPRVYYPKFLNM